MEIRPIRTDQDYQAALRRVESLWDCKAGSAECDELDVLATLVDAYEREHYPVDLRDPIEAIKFRLEQQGKDTRALIGLIGQRTRVYEVLRKRRALSPNDPDPSCQAGDSCQRPDPADSEPEAA